ncbi:MAG: nucleotidyltransferase family protein [Paludibacteraceae bacterium]|nr:nucleotidyltransferase family protein [Paludibacteraceae bacterium]
MDLSIKDTYFALLRAGIETAQLADNSLPSAQLTDVLALALRQGTGALVAEQLLGLPLTDAELKTQCKLICMRGISAQAEQRMVLRTAWTALEAGGIKPVLLKGLSLAHYYPKPYLRHCGDVDIYVGKDNYHPGAKILRETFPDAPRFETEEEYFKHYNLNVGATAIEMHRVTKIFAHPADDRLYDRLEREALQLNPLTYTDGEDTWREAEPKFNVLFVFIHSWEHFVTETANMRQLCDLTLLLKAASDGRQTASLTDYLRTNLTKLHLLHAWQLYAYILVKYLGLPQNCCPLYTDRCAEKAEALLEHILQGRVQVKPSGKAPKNVILRKLYTLRLRIADARQIAQIEPHYARHMVVTTVAQSWDRFIKGQNTRTWE